MLVDNGALVLGISGDSVHSQKLFKKTNKLNYPLLADINGNVAKKFGVELKPGGTIEKEIDGKQISLVRGVTPMRWTFVVGKDGKIAHKDSAANASSDSKNVLAIVKGLKGGS